MNEQKKRIVIAGAGPAGLACGYSLLRRFGESIELTIIEKEAAAGGLASGFEYRGLIFDYGSHRLHPTTRKDILDDIRGLLGDDLLDRPRNGRILLLDRFVKFPLKMTDFIFRLPPAFFIGILSDMLAKPFRKRVSNPDTFAEVLSAGLGKTICTDFYFPYAEKLWGLPPEKLSYIQAQRRVSADSIGKIIRKVLSIIPVFRKKGAGRFYYPRKGFLQLVSAFADAINDMGGTILLSEKLAEIVIEKQAVTTSGGKKIGYDLLLSTIPVTDLLNAMSPAPGTDVREAAAAIGYRGMLFCYLILDTRQFTPFDAHYFPDKALVFSRLSEPKNYSASVLPEGLTGLCAEIPCEVGGKLWNACEKEITGLVLRDLAGVGLGVDHLVKESFVRRTAHAYPSYDLVFERKINTVEAYLDGLPRIVSFGRQGLFVHDNTHHTIEMGYAASACVTPTVSWDREKWSSSKGEFATHVVED
ncbi:MAG: FAD-dependent oxidoreductase [Spirochaetales bacterium]|nr:FAD-dependent oxidoreductase [Spirochaetales bacterium]